jgi:3-methyladenine DNA glycosylase AlkC
MTKTNLNSFQREIARALNREDLESIVIALDKRSDKHAASGAASGTARGALKSLAAKMIRGHFQDRPRDLLNWCVQLLNGSSYNAHEVGLYILSDVYELNRRKMRHLLRRHANSNNWEVRETAGAVGGQLLDEHFDEWYPLLTEWSRDRSENVRRAVVIAAMKAAKTKEPKRGSKLLALLNPLMKDSSRYVRVNLGAFAISLSLLKHYPQLTLKWLDKHARSQNQYARWNVAMVWSAVGGRRYAIEGARILDRLAADDRRFVWRAVAAATVKLGKAQPSIIKPMIEKWSVDPQRQHAAQVVQQYL